MNDGRCTDYSFPGPCGSEVNSDFGDDFGWLITTDGTSVVELFAGTQSSMFGLMNVAAAQNVTCR